MANAAAAETMAATVKDLTGQVVNLATQAHQQANRPQPPDVSTQAQLIANTTVAEASKEAIKIVTEAARRDAAAQDPNTYLQNVLAVAKEIAPKPAGDGTSAVLVAMMQQMQQQTQLMITQIQENNRAIITQMQQSHDLHVKSMEARISAAEQRAAQPAPAGAAPTSNDPFALVMKVLDVVDNIKERTADVIPGAEGPAWLRPALTAVTSVANAVQTGMYNNAVAKTGQGTPLQPVIQDQEAIEAEGAQEMNPYQAFWNQVKPQLTKALQDGIPGYVFGAQLAIAQGASTYDQLYALGEQGIYQFISSQDPQFWSWTRPFAQRFGEFVGEFLQLEKVKAAVQELQIARENASAPPEPEPTRNPAPSIPRPKAQQPNQPGAPQAVVDARRNQQ